MADNETSPATATEKNEKISRQEKIILCSALISLFFCCVTLALPAPFLPKLVSFYAFLKVNVIIRYLYIINFSSWTPLLTVVLINSLHSSCWKLPPQRKGNSTVIEIITSLLILLYRKSQQIFTYVFLWLFWQNEDHNLNSDLTGLTIGLMPLVMLMLCAVFGRLVSKACTTWFTLT